MPKPRFNFGASEFQFDVCFSYPLPCGLQSQQRSLRTNGGGRRIQNVGRQDINVITANIANMSEAKLAELKAWFTDVVDWMANPFTYTDYQGLSQTVRMVDPADIETFAVTSYNRVSGTLRLEVEE